MGSIKIQFSILFFPQFVRLTNRVVVVAKVSIMMIKTLKFALLYAKHQVDLTVLEAL